MQSLQNEATTNFALNADTFSLEGGGTQSHLAVDEIYCTKTDLDSTPCGGIVLKSYVLR